MGGSLRERIYRLVSSANTCIQGIHRVPSDIRSLIAAIEDPIDR